MAPVLERNGVLKAVLFGSASSDTATQKSDIDLMILMETTKRFFDRFDDFDQIYDIAKGNAVDILIYTPDELKAISHRPFIKRILENGRTIYERREE